MTSPWLFDTHCKTSLCNVDVMMVCWASGSLFVSESLCYTALNMKLFEKWIGFSPSLCWFFFYFQYMVWVCDCSAKYFSVYLSYSLKWSLNVCNDIINMLLMWHHLATFGASTTFCECKTVGNTVKREISVLTHQKNCNITFDVRHALYSYMSTTI